MPHVVPRIDRKALVEQHLVLVRRIALRAHRSLGRGVELDDLIAWGAIGLLESVPRFDPARGVRFSTFAGHRIRGAIFDGLRRMGCVPRSQYARVRRELRATPTYLEQWDAYAAGAWPTLQGGERLALPRPELHPVEVQIDDARASRQVGAAVAALPGRERQVILECFVGGRSLVEAARAGRVTTSWASRLRTRAMAHLRDELAHLAAA